MSEGKIETTYRLRLRAGQVVRIASNKERVKTGKATGNVEILTNGAVIIGHDGRIVDVGSADDLNKKYPEATFDRDIDIGPRALIPGLVDSHTHPVWSGSRVDEFAMKLAGATYMEVAAKGGGISRTVNYTRNSSEDELLTLLLPRLRRMLKQGTTTVDAKSGYGLEADTEMRMLRAIERAKSCQPMTLVSNFLGAHSVPKGMTSDEATEDVIKRQIPALIEEKKKGTINPEQIDVFCEKNVFTPEQTRRILEAGKEAGLLINFHGDELTYTGSCELAADLGATAVSHIECVSDQGIKAMAEKGVVGVLLPTTAYVLRLKPPPARKLIEAGVPVALGSDFNPNAHCLSMPQTMNLACVLMHMTLEEALVAATLNSAAAMGKSDTYGSIEVGKQGDFVIVGAPTWEHIIYEMGDPPIDAVIKAGKVVYSSEDSHILSQ